MKKIMMTVVLAMMTVVGAYADTDISECNNVIYVVPETECMGNQVEVSICMKNWYVDVASFQFNIYLPKGISVAQNPRDPESLLVELSEQRTTPDRHNTFVVTPQADGSVLVLCASTNNYTFSGFDGEVCRVTLQVADDVLPDDYTITLDNIVLADNQATSKTYKAKNIETTLTITEATAINTANESAEPKTVYNLNGQMKNNTQQGINIVRYADGKAKKIMVE